MKPKSPEEAAALLREHDGPVRPRGGGTKPWGPPGEGTVLHTGGLCRIVEHNVGDFTAVLEAGVPLAEAQAAFAAEGQMLAIDPPADPRAPGRPAPGTSDHAVALDFVRHVRGAKATEAESALLQEAVDGCCHDRDQDVLVSASAGETP